MRDETNNFYKISITEALFLNDKPDSRKYLSSEEDNLHKKSLLFHVEQGDYFSTLATVLRFFEETIQDKNISPEMREKQLKTIEIVMSDLLFLSDNFNILPK